LAMSWSRNSVEARSSFRMARVVATITGATELEKR